MEQNKKHYILLIIILSSFLGFLLSEIALRFFAKDIVPIGIPDTAMGYVNRPNFISNRFNAESQNTIFIKTNKLGFRDTQWNTNSQKILILGDSFVEALQVPAEQRFSDLLETQNGIETMNAGISGSGPESYVSIAKFLINRFKINHLIVFIYNGNDLESINFNLTPESRRKNYLVEDGDVIPYHERAPFIERTWWNIKTVLGKSYLLQILKYVSQAYNQSWDTEYTYPQYCSLDEKTFFESSLILEHILIEIKTAADGIPVTVVSIPDKNQFTEPQREGCDNTQVEKVIRSITEKNSVTFVSLYEAFQNTGGKELYFAGHLNKKGHEVTANTLRKLLEPIQ